MSRAFRGVTPLISLYAAHAIAASTTRPIVFTLEQEPDQPAQKRWMEPGATPQQRAITRGPLKGKGTRKQRRAAK